MTTITVISRSGEGRQVEAGVGLSLMETIRDAGFDELLALCGGNCSCATCHVYVENAPTLATPGNDEGDLLDSSDHRVSNSRLACQIPFEALPDGLVVRIAPED